METYQLSSATFVDDDLMKANAAAEAERCNDTNGPDAEKSTEAAEAEYCCLTGLRSRSTNQEDLHQETNYHNPWCMRRQEGSGCEIAQKLRHRS